MNEEAMLEMIEERKIEPESQWRKPRTFYVSGVGLYNCWYEDGFWKFEPVQSNPIKLFTAPVIGV